MNNLAGATGADPVFFLSYAHTPKVDKQMDPDLLVAKFFLDLSRSVVQMSDLPIGAGIGFMDREFRPGYEWPARLAEALATCKVFVPLYSRRYFKSRHCGKEWSAFADRAAEVAARRGERVEAIVPALWVPVPDDRLAKVAQPIQYRTPGYGSRYATHGLYGLMTISKYRGEYEEVVHELAKDILAVTERYQLDPGPVADYDSLRDAFELGSDAPGESDQ